MCISRRIAASLMVWGLACLGLMNTSRAECPFCSAVSQTLRQEMEQTDLVALAKIVPGSETESDAEFEILQLLTGESLAREGQAFRVNYFGKAKEEQKFLLMGVDPPDLLWSSPLALSPEAVEYITTVSALPKEPMERLPFYLEHLEHPDNIIARDAYDEFASTPYSDIIALKDKMDREQLLKWIQKIDLPADRRRLYLVMLGVCGKPEDADLLEEMLRSEDPNRRSGMDALVACYVTLKREAGLELIDELFLANKQSQYADTYASIMALRFHGTEGGVLDRDRVQQSMQLLLERPELADLVIPDLARWEDWSQVDKVVELFKNADEKTSWVRVPVINYLRACPLPEAEEHLKTLKEIDPAAYKRAVSFFPVPKATPASTDGTSWRRRPAVEGRLGLDGMQLAFAGDLQELQPMVARVDKLAEPRGAAKAAGFGVNRAWCVGVIGMASVTCWLAMWLSITGAGGQQGAAHRSHRSVGRWLLQFSSSKG